MRSSLHPPSLSMRFAALRHWRAYLLMILMSVPFLFPFWWMISSSVKGLNDIFLFPPPLFPANPNWSNFVEVFAYQPFAQQYANSLAISSVVTIGVMLIASLSGYAYARIAFRGRSAFFLLVLCALMIPAEVTIIPNFRMMTALNWINTHVPLIIIPIFGAGSVFGTFMMRQFFLQLPREIEESGMLDGLNRFGIFTRIALPLARPALGALAVLTFLASWNAYLEPLLYVNDLPLFTLPLALANFVDAYGTPLWHLQLAATTLAVVPVLLVYVFAQRQIIDSFMQTGVKG
jgi:multiple sugar transport system permease protein